MGVDDPGMVHMRKKMLKTASLLISCAAAFGCNDHPVQKLDNVLTAVDQQTTKLPAKTKIDLLFMIDNSGSMCEEQANLTRNFKEISNFLFDDLGASADYRIAVISTDMLPANGEMGAFLKKPAEYKPSLNCLDTSTTPPTPLSPNTEDCFEDGFKLEQVLQSSGDHKNIESKEDLEKKFRCLATLGTGGDGFEKGLEAMRVSLSCAPKACLQACMNSGVSDVQKCRNQCYAPNSALFEPCCNDDGTYKLDCEIGEGEEEPTFLRPDALLVVIFITDEDDCSDPHSNPLASNRAICKYGTTDNNGDGVPDGFGDRTICGSDSPKDCFQKECGGLAAADCYKRRCEIDRGNNENCEWHRDELTPVRDYYEFLVNLKGQPIEQLMVATIVGERVYVSTGSESHVPYKEDGSTPVVTYQEGMVSEMCMAEDEVHSIVSGVCCKDGQCFGPNAPSCSSKGNGEAFAGKRYLELAELFEKNGIGCPSGSEGNLDECVTICQDDFKKPLEEIRKGIVQILGTYCLDQMPACQVAASRDELGNVVPARPCETEEEKADMKNYLIQVKKECSLLVKDGGNCQEIIAPHVLCPGLNCEPSTDAEGNVIEKEWELVMGAEASSCPGNALVRLLGTPEAGSEISIEFLAGSDDAASSSASQKDSGL